MHNVSHVNFSFTSVFNSSPRVKPLLLLLCLPALQDFSWTCRKEVHVCEYGGKETNSPRTWPKHYNTENNPGSSQTHSLKLKLDEHMDKD